MNRGERRWPPRQYQFRIGGHLGKSARHAFADMCIEIDGADTLVTVSLPDRNAIYALIDQIERLGLELVGIRPLLGEAEC